MAENLLKWMSEKTGFPRRADTEPEGPRDVVAMEYHAPHGWRYVRARLDDARFTVIGAGEWAPDRPSDAFGAETTVVLVANSDRSVCRVLDVASASPEQTRNMVALRLETELPYPVADAVWVCERHPATHANGTHVLVVATPESDLREARNLLKTHGVACEDIEFDAAALAELVRRQETPGDVTAVARVEDRRTLLAIIQDGTPRYVRRIVTPGLARQETIGQNGWTDRLAGELVQSLYDHRMRTEGTAPSRLIVTGEAAADGTLVEALAERMGIPVESAALPGVIEVAALNVDAAELITRYPACVGALLAVQQRLGGGRAAAPSLRSSGLAANALDVQRRTRTLVVATLALVVLLFGSLFGVRAAKLSAAENALKEMKPLAGDLARLQDEVDILQYESKRQRVTVDILAGLAKALPEELTVETVSLTSDGKIAIKGKTGSVTASDKAIAALKDSGMFAKPALLGATEEKGAYTFQISCELSKAQGKPSQ